MKKQPTYQTSDYSRFKVSETNRSLDTTHLRVIKRSLQELGWLSPYPINVVPRNGGLVIMDGQHRFTAAKALGIPILYSVEADRSDVQTLVGGLPQIPWRPVDFVTSYHNQGNPHYTKLLHFMEQQKLALGISAKLLMSGEDGSTDPGKHIKAGTFRVLTPEWADLLAEIIRRLKKIVFWASNHGFVNALLKAQVVPGFDHGHFLKKCEANPGLLILQPTQDAFLELIEKIYNHRTRPAEKLAIKFEATKNER
jgi:hypothetical protein